MKIRVKYILNKSWRYELQTKKWIFWKTIAAFSTLENVEEFVKKLKEVDDFNKSLNKSDNTIRIPVSVLQLNKK